MKNLSARRILVAIGVLFLLNSTVGFAARTLAQCLADMERMRAQVKAVIDISGRLMGERGLVPKAQDNSPEGWNERLDRLGVLLAEQGLTFTDFAHVVDLVTDMGTAPGMRQDAVGNLQDVAALAQLQPQKLAALHYVLREYFHTNDFSALENSPLLQNEYQRRLFIAYRRAYQYKLLSENSSRLSIPELRNLLAENGLDLSEGRIRDVFFAFGLARLERWRRPLTAAQRDRIEAEVGVLPLSNPTPLSVAIELWEAERSYEDIARTLSNAFPETPNRFGPGALRDIFHARGPEKKHRRWEDHEIDELAERYEYHYSQEIADDMGRTQGSVRGRAETQGLTRPRTVTSVPDFSNPTAGVPPELTQVKVNGYVRGPALKRYLEDRIAQNPTVLSPENFNGVAETLGMSPGHLRVWIARLGVTTPTMETPRLPTRMPLPDSGVPLFNQVALGNQRTHEEKLGKVTEQTKGSAFLEGPENQPLRDYLGTVLGNPEAGKPFIEWARKNPGKFKQLDKHLRKSDAWKGRYQTAWEAWNRIEMNDLAAMAENPLLDVSERTSLSRILQHPWADLSYPDRVAVVKAFVLLHGRYPIREAPGFEGQMASFIAFSAPRSSELNSGVMKPHYRALFDWAKTNQADAKVKPFWETMDPAARIAAAEVKLRNEQSLVNYAKTLELGNDQTALLSESENRRLAELRTGTGETISPADKTLLLKAFFLSQGRTPSEVEGHEGLLANFLYSLTPRSGETKPKQAAEHFEDLKSWADKHKSNPKIAPLVARLSPIEKPTQVARKTNELAMAAYAKGVVVPSAKLPLLTAFERERLAGLKTTDTEELSAEDRTLIVKAFILTEGRSPKNHVEGVEGALASFLTNMVPKAGRSEPDRNKPQFQDLLAWSTLHVAEPGIDKLHKMLSPEARMARVAAKKDRHQAGADYAKSLKLDSEPSALLTAAEKARLKQLGEAADQEPSPDDLAIILKGFVLSEGRPPTNHIKGFEGSLAKFLDRTTPKAGEVEPVTNKTQYQDLLAWARTHQKDARVAPFWEQINPETRLAKAVKREESSSDMVDYAKSLNPAALPPKLITNAEKARLSQLKTVNPAEVTQDDKLLFLKAYLVHEGRHPRIGITTGAEAAIAQYLTRITPRKGKTEPQSGLAQYKLLMEWAEAHRADNPAIQLIYDRLKR